MSEPLSYEVDGLVVFTSQYLKKKGTCCKSACLHCPYGYTLKKLGLQFEDVTEARMIEALAIVEESGQSADLAPFLPDNVKFVVIKEKVCGLMTKNHIVVKGLYLKKHFLNQGIDKPLVESYYFI